MAVIYTIGHSTRSLETLVAMLDAHRVRRLVDVRTVPRSRRHPQFNRDSLPEALGDIAYVHMPGLGGLRRPAKDSINTGWRNASFRGYADHMQTDSFREALEAVIAAARLGPVAIMCAEALPWRCHRSLIADVLTTRGIIVCHIMSVSRCEGHSLTPFARVEGSRLTYPAAATDEPQPRLPFTGT